MTNSAPLQSDPCPSHCKERVNCRDPAFWWRDQLRPSKPTVGQLLWSFPQCQLQASGQLPQTNAAEPSVRLVLSDPPSAPCFVD